MWNSPSVSVALTLHNGPADGVVVEAKLLHLLAAIDIATIEDCLLLQARCDLLKIGMAELAPLSANDEGVGAIERFVHAIENLRLGKRAVEVGARHRVVGVDSSACLQRALHERD